MKTPILPKDNFSHPIAVVVALLTIWCLVIGYLTQTPSYATNWSIVLPHVTADTKVTLDDVGQAQVSSKSPFSMPGISPVESYKQIILSAQVRKEAARRLNISIEDLPTPRVDTILQTSVIRLKVKENDPERATKTAFALHDAFIRTLNDLRQDEIRRRENSLAEQLKHYQERVNTAQQKVLEHRAQAALMSTDQFDQAGETLSELKAERLRVGALLVQRTATQKMLASQLGITPDMANDAFSLQTDAVFQSLLGELRVVSGQLPIYQKKWGKNHPKLAAARHDMSSINEALLDRATQLVGHREFNHLQLITLAQSPQRAELFATMLNEVATVEGLVQKAQQIDQDIITMDRSLRVDLRERSRLEALNREYQIAEAVFVSALTKHDGHRSDIFSVYPMVQLLSPPSSSSKATSPITALGIAAGIIGSLLILITVFVLRNREKWLRAILKNS